MCADCEARRRLARDALLRANVLGAFGHVAKGVAEAAGLKAKSGESELRAKSEKPRLSKPNPAQPANQRP